MMNTNENTALAKFSMTITKASIPAGGKKDRVMRLSMVTSDTDKDSYEERMSEELFHDFVERIENNVPVPAPFDSVVQEDGWWLGGMPYSSISHYKSGKGKNVPGEVERVYVDGALLKANTVLSDTPFGVAVWKSVCQDIEERSLSLEEKTYSKPVRVSIGFLDLEHKHELDDGEYVFTRTNLKQICPKCEKGINNGKVYQKGQLVHLAFTREPANPRTSVEVLKMNEEILTRKDDAESIIGELADELVGKSAIDVLVVKAEEEKEGRDQKHEVEKSAQPDLETVVEEDMEKLKEEVQAVEPAKEAVVALQPKKSKVDEATERFRSKLSELTAQNVTGDLAVKELQPLLNELGRAAQDAVTNPVERAAEINRSVIKEEISAAIPEIVAQILKSLPAATAQPVAQEIPQARSLFINRSATPENNEEMSQIKRIARNSTIGVALGTKV